MNQTALPILGSLLVLSSLVAPVRAADVPQCAPAQLLGYKPSEKEVAAHRRFAVPVVISYPFGTQLEGKWGVEPSVAVDSSGRVVCYGLVSIFGRNMSLDGARNAIVKAIGQWRYDPFTSDGRPVAAVVTEQVREQELPQHHMQLPAVPLAQVRITLRRGGCFGSCPSYQVELHGDGSVVYSGDGFVDVEGEHRYSIPASDVARLVQSLRDADIWSLRPAYHAGITDQSTYFLTLAMGGQTHELEDYVGGWAGMPGAVTAFEADVDATALSDMWVHLSVAGVEKLKAESFAFASQAGANLLARAVTNEDSHDDQAMLRLIDLGAPIEGANPDVFENRTEPSPLIEAALRQHRAILIAPLIARGALNTNGKPDQAKIDAAFRSAIVGGRLTAVEQIWVEAGTRPHPSLVYDSASEHEPLVHKIVPVTLLLARNPRQADQPWEGLDIARWLIARGCAMTASGADGRTLLHIATKAGDAAFVRYLLAQGMDASTPGEFGLPALGSAESEEIAMLLLEAGTDVAKMDALDKSDGPNSSFREQAEEEHWQRVLAWLDAHHHQPE